MLRLILPMVALLLGVADARGADSAAGQIVFNRCKICHAIDPAAGNRVGPNLHALFGRKAGTAPGFNYSAAMKDSGITWEEEALAKYLRDPRAFLPGNKMAFPGIKDDTELADLLAYLKQATQ